MRSPLPVAAAGLVLVGAGLLLAAHTGSHTVPPGSNISVSTSSHLGPAPLLYATTSSRPGRVGIAAGTAAEPAATGATSTPQSGPPRSPTALQTNRASPPVRPRTSPTSTRSPTPPPRPVADATGPRTAVAGTADTVNAAALTALHTSDTTTDRSPRDAFQRALPLLGGQLAADIRTSTTQPTAPGAQWAQWAAHRAYTVVTLARAGDDGAPADTVTTAYRQWTVTVTPVGRDHWQTTPVRLVTFTVLTRTPTGWGVTDLAETQDPAAPTSPAPR